MNQPSTSALKLHHEIHGDGLPVLMIHGFPFDRTIWKSQVAALSSDYRVITPDLRGHGQTPASDGVYTMDLLAHDVLALLDELGVERAVWVGHSMGGYLSMAALRLAPERLMGLALVATHPHADSEDRRIQRIQSAESALENGSANIALSMMSMLFATNTDPKSPTARGVYDIMIEASPEGLNGALRGMAERPESVATLQALSIPALVIAGAEDQIVDVAVAEKMAAMIPQAELVVVPEAGHMVMVEQPDATNEALRRFLSQY